jgi:hypothetical protein
MRVEGEHGLPHPKVRAAPVFVYISCVLLGSLGTTLPFCFRPYPANPFLGLWILDSPVAIVEATGYALHTVGFLGCLGFVLWKQDVAPPEAHVLRLSILCAIGAIRSLGQMIIAFTLVGAEPGDSEIEGVIATELLMVIAFGDGRGLLTTLMFGMTDEHVAMLKSCFSLSCCGVPSLNPSGSPIVFGRYDSVRVSGRFRSDLSEHSDGFAINLNEELVGEGGHSRRAEEVGVES